MRAGLCDDAFDPVRVAAIDPCIRVAFVQEPGIVEEAIEPPASCASHETSVSRSIARSSILFDIEDPNLGVPSCCDHGPVIGVWHKFYREYVLRVARVDARIEGEWSGL